ncbi:hypothetical protein J8I26_14665 [Herbaspirillum sp. LeCh32-8]|uniref:hypothetical protein n=1 Tax=Herbaspirillum sp. LeCh32-8 TaxID=2821356 RepID=UPI001AE814EB|nr:hypothetical protein [Herbaspirillum sp. LeCh32-8]MBP0599359.1 hypothetical protein [Herbaspirillum sp. LeCh32-8]
MKSVIAISLLAITALSGCAYKASPYGVSPANVNAIKATGIKPVAVLPFTATKPGAASITCRAAGPVRVVPSFERYIEGALIDELKLASAYDPASDIKISGKLEQIDFSSGMSDGAWMFVLTISNAKNASFTVNSKWPFSGSFVADKACQEVAQAFGPSVQNLIKEVIQDPRFKQLAQ